MLCKYQILQSQYRLQDLAHPSLCQQQQNQCHFRSYSSAIKKQCWLSVMMLQKEKNRKWLQVALPPQKDDVAQYLTKQGLQHPQVQS